MSLDGGQLIVWSRKAMSEFLMDGIGDHIAADLGQSQIQLGCFNRNIYIFDCLCLW